MFSLTSKKFEEGKDMMLILEYLMDPKASIDAEEPEDLTIEEMKSPVKQWLKQEEVKQHSKRLKALKRNKEKLHALIWGQLTHGLQEVVKSDDDFIPSDNSFDCIWLLAKVKLISVGVDSKANKHYKFLEALTSFCTVQQGGTESNDSFRKRLDAAGLTLRLAGGAQVLCNPELIESSTPEQPTAEEVETETEKMKAMMMILRSDGDRYETLKKDLHQSVYRGRDEFPTTVTSTYDLLQHTSAQSRDENNNNSARFGKFRFRKNQNNRNGNFTFTQSSSSSNSDAVPGRDGKLYTHVKCHHCHTPGHYANECPAKDAVTLAHFSLTQKKLELINKNWILLDTCSTVSVFCNADLVDNIQNCLPGNGITAVTNGGSEHFKQNADLKLLPMNVHFNSNSIANILSLSDIANLEGARLTMDSSVERAINLHVDGDVIQFKECSDGLYYFDASHASHNHSNHHVTPYSTTLVQTVKSNQSLYTKRDIQGADRARALQQQLGWPSNNVFLRIINDNLIHNSSVTIQDIKQAQYIYGTPPPLLKGHMIRTQPTAVQVQTVPPPQQILGHYPTLQLYVDFFYVNRIPFLHTKCSDIGFLTAHGGVGPTISAIKKVLDSVFNLYETRGFNITDIHGDNEFDVKSLKEYLLPIVTHIYGRGEHVAVIERSNRTIKEKCRVICHSLPFKRYTKLMTLMLVEFVLHWLNAIPSTGSASNFIGPATIIEGSMKPYFKYKHLPFGTYCMIYIGTKNNMKARSVPGISLAPSNQWGGHYFMSLISGKKIHGYKWTEIPIGADVIDRVLGYVMKQLQ